MAIFYKLFQRARIAFSYSFFAAVFIAGGAFAQDRIFTVEDVKIDVSADNAIAAREKAFEEAQVKAFETLAERMLSANELTAFKAPEASQISLMVKDYEVSNEKLSAKRYSASYTFRFRDDDVRGFFGQRGMAYTDVTSRPLLILPYLEMEDGRGMTLWSPYNIWMQAWNQEDGGGALVPVTVPIGDLMDVNDLGDEEALSYNPRRLSAIVSRYDAAEAVIAIAYPKPEQRTLDIQVYRTDRGQPEFVQQVSQPLSGARDMNAYKAAVSKVREALRADWKSRTMVVVPNPVYDPNAIPGVDSNTAGESVIKVRARFVSLEEWTQIRGRLQKVSAIHQMDLKALSPREAYIDLYYSGDMQRLVLAMRQAGMRLEGVAQSSVYDLVYDRYGAVEQAPSYAPSAPAVQMEGGRSHDKGRNFFVPDKGTNQENRSVQKAQSPSVPYSAEF